MPAKCFLPRIFVSPQGWSLRSYLFRCSVTSMLLCILVSACLAQQKKRVAVLDFDYGTVQSSASAIFGTNVDVGKGISDLLVQKLVQDGKYSVIERNAIEKVLHEQNFSNSDRADSATAAKIGRILGVDAIILGTITQFGRDDKSTGVGGGALGGFGSKFGIGGVKKNQSKAVVAVSARMVDTTTAEILTAVTGQGESTRSGMSLIGGGAGGGSGAGGSYDMTSANFGATILGQAVHQAVDSVGDQLEQHIASLPTRKIVIDGLVADVSGDTLVLNVGSKAGVKVGDTLDISRAARTIKDPATGKILKTIKNKVGTATVTEVDDVSSTATYTGTGRAKVGDAVKNAE